MDNIIGSWLGLKTTRSLHISESICVSGTRRWWCNNWPAAFHRASATRHVPFFLPAPPWSSIPSPKETSKTPNTWKNGTNLRVNDSYYRVYSSFLKSKSVIFCWIYQFCIQFHVRSKAKHNVRPSKIPRSLLRRLSALKFLWTATEAMKGGG